MSIASDGIFTFTKNEFTCKFRDPLARDILRVRYEHALLNMERRRKMAKHAETQPNLLMQLQVSDAADAEIEFFAAAIIEPKMTVDDVANLPGSVFEALSVAFNRTIRGGEFLKFQLSGPGVPEDSNPRVVDGPRIKGDARGNSEYALERSSSSVEPSATR